MTDKAARMTFAVPTDAEIWIEGVKTTSTGPVRTFTSPPLQAGKDYVWTVRLRWTQDGKPVERTRRVDIRAGDHLALDVVGSGGIRSFSFEPESSVTQQPAPRSYTWWIDPINRWKPDFYGPFWYTRNQ